MLAIRQEGYDKMRMIDKVPFLDLGKQYQNIKSEMDAAIQSVIMDGAFVGGRYVDQFEKQFGEFLGGLPVVGVGNGTDALEIAIEALCLPTGSEIIVPGNSFFASSEAISRAGCKPVFADVSPTTYTMENHHLEQALSDKTSAIMIVHLYGHPCEIKSILEFASKNNLRVIEDCAQAHGAMYFGKHVGGFGDIAAFSFYPGKNLGAYGDAGAIVSRDIELAKSCRMIANHGRVEKYTHKFEGRNSRLDGIQAAVLSVKLSHLTAWIDTRNLIADYYMRTLENVGDLILPVVAANCRHAFHLFVVRTNFAKSLAGHLANDGIECGQHYPISLPKQPAYSSIEIERDLFVNQTDERLLSLPIGDHMTTEMVETVCSSIKKFFSKI